MPLFLPPLRERKEDIPLLIEHFIDGFNKEYKKNISLTNSAFKRLLEYQYPGNIRELENIVERLIVLSENRKILENDLPLHLRIEEMRMPTGSLLQNIEEMEKRRITEALKECNFNQAKAAKVLGITPRQISYKITKYGIKAL